MILLLEVAMAVVGLLALIRGRLTLSRTKVVEGVPARLLGVVALAPLPLAFAMGFFLVILTNPADPQKFLADNQLTFAAVEGGLMLGAGLVVVGVGVVIGTDPEEDRRRRRKRRRRLRDEDEGEFEDDDRPRPRQAYEVVDEDDEGDDRRRRRLRDEDGFEDDPGDRPRRYRDDEDEDDDDRPRRR